MQIEEAIQDFCKLNNVTREFLSKNPSWQDDWDMTVAMFLAYRWFIPPKEWYHDPSLQTTYGNLTVAMYLADHEIIPPKEWCHSPELQSKFGKTVAINLAEKGIIPPKEWYHDPNLQDYEGWTVAMILADGETEVPEEWFIDHNAVYEKHPGTCCICLQDYENGEFMKWKGYHEGHGVFICKQCFLKQVNQQNGRQCPICKGYDYYIQE